MRMWIKELCHYGVFVALIASVRSAVVLEARNR